MNPLPRHITWVAGVVALRVRVPFSPLIDSLLFPGRPSWSPSLYHPLLYPHLAGLGNRQCILVMIPLTSQLTACILGPIVELIHLHPVATSLVGVLCISHSRMHH